MDFASHTCSICYGTVKPPVSVLPCGHFFCQGCLQLYSETRIKMHMPIKCPLCNREVTVEEMTVVKDDATEMKQGKWGSKID